MQEEYENVESITDHRIKVALVWPFGFDVLDSLPLPLGYLKSNADETKFNIKIFDCVLNNIDSTSPELRQQIEEFRPEVLGFTCFSPMFPECLKVARLAKSIDPTITTIIGGCHATSYSEKVMDYAEFDFLFRGEGEIGFNQFLEQRSSPEPNFSEVMGLMYRDPSTGVLKSNGISYVMDLDTVKIPDYDFMNLSGYIKKGYRMNSQKRRNAPILATRGCPYRCTFCAAPALNGRKIRTHSNEYLTKWISVLYDNYRIRWINIIDDNFTFYKKYAKSFCRMIIERNFKRLTFGTPNGIRMTRGDVELWQLMKKAGWRALVVAPETGSQRTLDLMKKDLDIKVVPQIVKDIKSAGLRVQAFFIVGYPGEKKEDVLLTGKLIKENPFDFASLHTFQPLPGTPVYEELVTKGEIVDGTLPRNYTTGETCYVTEDLKDFNFSRFVIKTYLMMALRHPLNVPYILSLFSPQLFLKKLISNIVNMFIKRTAQSDLNQTIRSPEGAVKQEKNQRNEQIIDYQASFGIPTRIRGYEPPAPPVEKND